MKEHKGVKSMGYYHGTLTEINGEREYSYTYLIKARNLKEAEEKLHETARTFLMADGEPGEEIDPGVFEFEGGCYVVKVDGLRKTSKKEYVNDVLCRELLT